MCLGHEQGRHGVEEEQSKCIAFVPRLSGLSVVMP